ncbi:MAG: hypothetical protein ABWY38_03730 [Methyloceanibacter sp.]
MKRAAAAAAATAIAVASAGACFAADPVEVLPEALFATGNGCAVIKKKLPEDVETFTFYALYNTDLYGPDLVCNFTDATKAAVKSGTLWTVKGNCQFGAVTKPSTIVIKQDAGKKGATVSMTNVQGQRSISASSRIAERS